MNPIFDKFLNLLKADRSVRRFDESQSISIDVLRQIVGATRFCASGRNLQPLRYRIVTESEVLNQIYPLLKWAGYLTDWDGPTEGERPTAFIIQLLDTDMTNNCMCDDGLHLQTITLGATANDLGSCIIKSFNTLQLLEVLSIPPRFQPLHVVAIGVPAEKVVIEDIDFNSSDIKYWRDSESIHHVPKRLFKEL